MSPEEIATIEKYYGKKAGDFLKLARDYDDRVARDSILPEDRRRQKDAFFLERLNMDAIMSMALTNTRTIEYTQDKDPYIMTKDNLVKITGKSKKQQANLDSRQSEIEREDEIKALLAQPDQADIIKAAKLAKESRL